MLPKGAYLAIVYWEDPCYHPSKGYQLINFKNAEGLLASQQSIGYVVDSGRVLVVVNNITDDKTENAEMDITVIPKTLVTKIERFSRRK